MNPRTQAEPAAPAGAVAPKPRVTIDQLEDAIGRMSERDLDETTQLDAAIELLEEATTSPYVELENWDAALGMLRALQLERNLLGEWIEHHGTESTDGPGETDAPEHLSRPRLTPGVELIGEFKDSGFKNPPYLARRPDGQVVQLPHLLYVLAEKADGHRRLTDLARMLSDRLGREVSEDNVRFLAEEKLLPLGVIDAPKSARPALRRNDPMLALKMRTAVVSEGVTNFLSVVFRPAFWPPVIVAVLAALAVFDYWLFFDHSLAQGAAKLLQQPFFMLGVFGAIILSAAFHEIGHATACRYGGARPGPMGIGFYIVWPAFYTDVTDAYRLGRWGRLRTDLGGIYFNVIFSLLTAAVYFMTGFEPLLFVIVMQHFEIVHQLLPFLRLDGYYIISDLTGVPDMFARIKPTLRSLLPWRETDPKVAELKPWVRVVTTLYVLALIPGLAFIFIMVFLGVPEFVPTAVESLHLQWLRLDVGIETLNPTRIVGGLLQILVLALPLIGVAAMMFQLARRTATGAWRVTTGRPLLRAVMVPVGLASVLVSMSLWSHQGRNPTRVQAASERAVKLKGAELKYLPLGALGIKHDQEEDNQGG